MNKTYSYEELNKGDTFTTAGRTIDQCDINKFAGLSGDHHQLHTNDTYAKAAGFDKRIAHGILTLAISSGLLFRLGLLEENGLAHLGSTEKYLCPVYAGDTIHAEITILDKSLKSSGRAIITVQIDTINQDNQVVLTQEMNVLLRCKENAA